MMTIVQLRQLIGNQIGLPESFDGSMTAYGNLSREAQIALTQGMIAYIRNNPASFTPAQLVTAETEAGRAEKLTLDDTSFDTGLFFAELEKNANAVVFDPLVKVGQGISTSVSLVGTLLPVFALVAVAIFAWPYVARARRA